MMRNLSQAMKREGLVNYMEEVTDSMLARLIAGQKRVRFSENALQDIKALALNRLWPMYTTTNTGRDYLKKSVLADEVDKDVVRELKAAMAIVRERPRR